MIPVTMAFTPGMQSCALVYLTQTYANVPTALELIPTHCIFRSHGKCHIRHARLRVQEWRTICYLVYSAVACASTSCEGQAYYGTEGGAMSSPRPKSKEDDHHLLSGYMGSASEAEPKPDYHAKREINPAGS